MKEHEIREVVNRCRDIAVQYAHSQQLREVLGAVIKDAIAKASADAYSIGVKDGMEVEQIMTLNEYRGRK